MSVNDLSYLGMHIGSVIQALGFRLLVCSVSSPPVWYSRSNRFPSVYMCGILIASHSFTIMD